ncbi:O-antigen ligase family protein [Micromonospora sp. NPDC050417]|uniref:O-antigen ligase family protein n=1 Tax=Micromonospora sp. NPDC050417 TaxID=3364280 RepID=UPI0037A30BB7
MSNDTVADPVDSGRPAGTTGPVRASRLAAIRSLLVLAISDPGQRVTTGLLVVTLGLVPVALLPAESPIYAGITNATPTLYTFTLTLGLSSLLMVMLAGRRFRAGLLPWAPFLLWLLTLTVVAWGWSPRTVSGLLHLCLGAIAFAIGVAAHHQDRGGSALAWVFAAVAWVQLGAIVAAVLGFPLREVTGAQALDVHGRATGLTSHPGELSKVLFFCGLCVLTLPQRTARERVAVWLTLGAVFVGTSLTQSRAVLAAVMAMILISVLLELAGGRWQRKHFVILGTTVVLGLASLPWLINRFMADPTGGARPHITQVALSAIGDHPWAGVGPNGYVAVIGATDRLTETGVPVHNIFLLSAAELGILGAVLLWLPFLVVAVRAIRRVRLSRGADPTARVLVSALPGIVLIGATGWGLLQGPYFLIFSLVMGYFGARIGEPYAKRADVRL